MLKVSCRDQPYSIDYTIIIILEFESSILLLALFFNFFIAFLGCGGLLIFLNVDTEICHSRRLPISRRLIRRVPNFSLKMIPIVHELPYLTPFRYLGLAVDNCLFLRAFNFCPVPLFCTQIGTEEVISLLKTTGYKIRRTLAVMDELGILPIFVHNIRFQISLR